MANNFSSNTEKRLAQAFIKNFESARVLTKTVNTQIVSGQSGFTPKTGDTVFVRRPYETEAVETAGGDITGLSNDIISGQAPVTVQNMITTFAEWDVIDQAIRMDRMDEIMKPYATRLVTRLEANLGRFMQRNSGLLSGAPGTPITAWSDIAAFNTLMESMGIPTLDGNAYAVISPAVRQSLADQQSGLASGDNSLVNEAWKKSMISKDFGGIQALSSNHIPTYQSGATTARTGTLGATPTATYLDHKDTMIQTLALTGLSAGVTDAVRPGDQIVITQDGRSRINPHTKEIIFDVDGDPVEYTFTVVTGGDTDSSGDVTVTATCAAINESGGAYNNIATALASGDTFTILGSPNETYQSALFYHKDAFALATVDIPKLYSTDTIMRSEDGFVIRMSRYADGDANTNKVRFDLLPAYGVLNPAFSGNGFGIPS